MAYLFQECRLSIETFEVCELAEPYLLIAFQSFSQKYACVTNKIFK